MSNRKKYELFLQSLNLKLSLEEAIEAARFNLDKDREAVLVVVLVKAERRHLRRCQWLPIKL